MTFTIGQRWISNSESQLGLGMITGINGRHVTINFPAADEERTYASDNAPLSRIVYKEGDKIYTYDQKSMEITGIEEHKGLCSYLGIDAEGNTMRIDELALDCFIKLTTPKQRLLNNQFDKLRSFKLRIDTLNHLSRQQQSSVRGLLGSRTNHLPHQIYIANEVAQRYAPRVLLADEVGLGKTIEAGMILHHQLYTGRASRVLIVVPSTLIHQWLVEMIRRFNLYFSIVDQGRYEQMIDDNLDDEVDALDNVIDNPFESEQLILCSIDFLIANNEARQHATAATWDILVVDEAHHLEWSEEETSPKYACIEALSLQSKGLLLLTATPEQVGIQSHFARLRLLDPSRFYDLATFKKEETGYQALNQLVQALIQHRETSNDTLTPVLRDQLTPFFNDALPDNIDTIIQHLLDRHGTGRVLFRNTRAAIQGFPDRHLQAYPLPLPPIYESSALYPELASDSDDWLQEDPRVLWLITELRDRFPQKVLVICANASTAVALEHYLNVKIGIRSTSFHEGLSIIDRDRAAAYFSEEENGAQTLICSEIGSEGRNFQFAHHLVLFDLPLNPDLLEQRIGRLDRIGQQHTIEIHVPYLRNTAQEKLFRWYHEGLNCFEKNSSASSVIYEKFMSRLFTLLNRNEVELAEWNALIEETQVAAREINQALHEGRDRLLEVNSCNRAIADGLIIAVEAEENSLTLENYMATVFQEYGIEHEHHSEYAEILHPSEHMKTSHFPGLKEEGLTVTYSRTKALCREDMAFLSWEHPMVSESMEMILDSEVGNVTLATLSIKGLPPGTLFLETFHTANAAAPSYLQVEQFLPLTPIRLFMDITGKNLSGLLSYEQLNGLCESIKRHAGEMIIKQIKDQLETLLAFSNTAAEAQLIQLIAQANLQMKEKIGEEVNRLRALQTINPSIRDEEITFLNDRILASEHFINQAALKLQAVRVLINR